MMWRNPITDPPTMKYGPEGKGLVWSDSVLAVAKDGTVLYGPLYYDPVLEGDWLGNFYDGELSLARKDAVAWAEVPSNHPHLTTL